MDRIHTALLAKTVFFYKHLCLHLGSCAFRLGMYHQISLVYTPRPFSESVTLTADTVPISTNLESSWRVKNLKSNPITGLGRPCGFQEVEAPRFQDSRHIKVVRLSALHTGRLYPPGNIPGTHFCKKLCRPQGHSAARRIMPMENSNITIVNRTQDLLASNAVPQPTAPPRASNLLFIVRVNFCFC